MKRSIQLLLGLVLLILINGCASTPYDEESYGDEGDGFEQASGGDGAGSKAASDMDFQNETNSSKAGTKEQGKSGEDVMPEDFSQGENEIMTENQAQSGTNGLKDELAQQNSAPETDPLLEEDLAAQGGQPQNKMDASSSSELPPPTDDFMPAQSEPVSGGQSSNVVPSGAIGRIKNIRFESNDGGGTVVIEGDQPLNYTSRFNDSSKQFIIEVNHVNLPNSLKRPYNTRDFQGQVGSIDAYQSPGSDTARIVVQLKEGATEPTIHPEGNNLMMVSSGGGAPASPPEDSNALAGETDVSVQGNGDDMSINGNRGILSSASLQQFLSSNMKFYGRKISLEMKDISVRDAINMIAEESGANLVMTESVAGNLSLKLRQVPWDQALVMILKAKKLGYTRQGNVLRITAMADIRQEEDDAIKYEESKRKIDPLIVQMIPVNYAKIEDMRGQVQTVLSERGKAIADGRTNALIITDTVEVLERVKKMVASLDVPPAQVLIEGKIVEARESFEKKIGIQWDMFGQDVNLGNGTKGPTNMSPTLSIHPGINQGSSLGFNLRIGNIDLLGDLSSMLALEEREDNVKVISSPRIVTLHNEKASITQSSQIPIIVGSAATNNVNTFAQRTRDVVYKQLQMHLNVTPQVANNGNVILTVDVKREFPGAVTDEQSGAAPIHSREAQTKVMVKNGQTAVIGGIYQNDARNAESGVPFLKDIPVLGFLFRSENQSKDKTELLLFLTPRVLSQSGSTQVSSQEISNIEVQ